MREFRTVLNIKVEYKVDNIEEAENLSNEWGKRCANAIRGTENSNIGTIGVKANWWDFSLVKADEDKGESG